MSQGDLVITAARVMTPTGIRPGTVWVNDGQISRIGAADDIPDDVRLVHLAEDEVLLPGIVDAHVHVNEPGRTDWEGFATATRAAAAGGVTTLLDMPLNCVPATTSAAALSIKQEAADDQCWVDVGFWGGAVPDNLDDMRGLTEAGVFGFKCFMVDSGVPEFPHLTTLQILAAMREIASLGGYLIVHAEDPALVLGADLHSRRYDDFLRTRPAVSEVSAITTLIEAVRSTGCRTHIVHLSAADALVEIAAARAEGLPLTVETCPHYLTLNAEEILDGATQFKCCPPVRGGDNADRLWQALAEGLIDYVASDHSPSRPELKSLEDGDFGAAWGGISSLQLGLSLIWTEGRQRGHSLESVSRWMSANPAQILGVVGKGSIEIGNDADLVIFAPDEEWTVDAAALHHRHAVTPYDGRQLRGVVRATYLRGSMVDVNGSPGGRFVRPSQS